MPEDRLRHPRFAGIRANKDVRDVARETRPSPENTLYHPHRGLRSHALDVRAGATCAGGPGARGGGPVLPPSYETGAILLLGIRSGRPGWTQLRTGGFPLSGTTPTMFGCPSGSDCLSVVDRK